MIECNGLYIGLFGGDPYIFRVEWYDDDISHRDYQANMGSYTVGQPIGVKMPPLQAIYLSSVEDIAKVRLYDSTDIDSMWLSLSFDWAKLYIRWHQAKLRPYEYVQIFNDEVLEQYASKD